jgi:hypothetical protein
MQVSAPELDRRCFMSKSMHEKCSFWVGDIYYAFISTATRVGPVTDRPKTFVYVRPKYSDTLFWKYKKL